MPFTALQLSGGERRARHQGGVTGLVMPFTALQLKSVDVLFTTSLSVTGLVMPFTALQRLDTWDTRFFQDLLQD